MLIAMFSFVAEVLIPQVVGALSELVPNLMVIVIMLAGLVMIFGSVGFKISNNLGATVTGGLFRGIGFLFRQLFNAIGWIIKSIARLLPWVFKTSRKSFDSMGLKEWTCNLFATAITLLVLAVII